MNLINHKIKIATILPYKENYTFSKAQAAIIWVADFFKFSKYHKENYIFGNTSNKDYLTSNYINVPLKNKKSKFTSIFIEYCRNFVEKLKIRILILLKFITDL